MRLPTSLTPMRNRLSRRELLRLTAIAGGAAALGHLKVASTSILMAAESVSPFMTTLSAYMAAAKDRALPPDVVDAGKHHILDTFAAMISGSKLPPGQAALALARSQAGRPLAT